MTDTTPSLFTFGCMSLGSDLALLDQHIRVARQAMDAGVWFHASPTYHRGFTYMVLRLAFDEAPGRVPPMMIKIRCADARVLRFEVEDALRRLGIDCIHTAQLVFTETGPAALAHDFVHGGPIAEVCAKLHHAGMVLRFCPQCGVASSPTLLPLVERRCFDGFTLYLNPAQRDADPALWAALQQHATPLWALRTLAGAVGHDDRFAELQAAKPDDPAVQNARRLRHLAAEAGLDWTTFCMRYARSVPHLQTTIGGTANPSHLDQLLSAATNPVPLPDDLLHAIHAGP